MIPRAAIVDPRAIAAREFRTSIRAVVAGGFFYILVRAPTPTSDAPHPLVIDGKAPFAKKGAGRCVERPDIQLHSDDPVGCRNGSDSGEQRAADATSSRVWKDTQVEIDALVGVGEGCLPAPPIDCGVGLPARLLAKQREQDDCVQVCDKVTGNRGRYVTRDRALESPRNRARVQRLHVIVERRHCDRITGCRAPNLDAHY